MKRLLLLILILGLLPASLLAQRTFILSNLHPKSFINVSVGYSQPFWTPFGKSSQNLLGEGQSLQVAAGYRPGRLFGIVATYTDLSNTILKDRLPGTIPVNFTGVDWQTSATNCTLKTYMVGPLLTVQKGLFLFDFQLTAGYAVGTSSRMELVAPDTRPAMYLTTPSMTTQSVAAGAGISIRYKINRWLAVQANANYVTADLKFKNLAQEIIIGPQHSVEPVAAHQPIGLLNTGGGLSFMF